MDEVLARQLLRQLKIIKVVLTFFAIVFIVSMVVLGIVLFKIVTFVHTRADQLYDFQQKASNSLNVKSDLCSNSSISSLLQDKSTLCK